MVWKMLGYIPPNLDPLPELPLKRGILLCLFFLHSPCTWILLGRFQVPWNVSFKGPSPRMPRHPDCTFLPELHFKAMRVVLEGDQSSLNSTVIRIFSLCISLASECQQHIS